MLHVPVHFAIDQRQLIDSVEQEPIARTLVHRVFRLHKQLHVVQADVSDPSAEAFKTDATLSVSDDVTQSHILDGARRTVSPLLHGKPDGVSVSPPKGFFPAGRDGDVQNRMLRALPPSRIIIFNPRFALSMTQLETVIFSKSACDSVPIFNAADEEVSTQLVMVI